MNVPFERDRERHFGLGKATLDEAESDIEEDSIVNGFASITLSREDIARIRAPWTSSLIIKTLGKVWGSCSCLQRLELCGILQVG